MQRDCHRQPKYLDRYLRKNAVPPLDLFLLKAGGDVRRALNKISLLLLVILELVTLKYKLRMNLSGK